MDAHTKEDQHPMLELLRPAVATREIESLSNAILVALEMSYRGIGVYAYARFGKSEAATYLRVHKEWLGRHAAAILSFLSPLADKRTDGSFASTLLTGLNVRISSKSTPDERMQQLASFLIERCQAANAKLVLIMVDDANRLKPGDYEHLVTLDNKLTAAGYYLFIVSIFQRDVTGFTNESVTQSEYPPHVHGRFLVRKHEFSGVRNIEDLAYYLSRYDDSTEWPAGSGVSYSRHFAPLAFENGWRLAHEAPRLWAAAEKLRDASRLPSTWTWPMKSIEGTVAYLLTNVAPNKPDFQGLSDKDIDTALDAAGYIELELSRHTYAHNGA
ncbi:MAG TPA: hypothetical protein VF292_00380 [Rhodanobacteraceae bacterium]